MGTPTLADLIDEAELSQLQADYGPGERRRATLEMSHQTFDDRLRKMLTKPNRRGEAVLTIQRPDGQTLLHTKQFYPEGVYRLPSGGVYPNESALSGAIREAREETGLEVSVDRFLGTVEYEICYDGQRLPFVSYVFLLQAGDDWPVVQDLGEQITGFRYVTTPEIRAVAAQLRGLSPEWADWGRLRALPHDLVADVLGA